MDQAPKHVDKRADKWCFEDYKIIKVLRNGRLAFQRKGRYTRGISISKDAFLKMEDVTINSGMRMELESNVYLSNYGDRIQLIKYCVTSDGKQCNGGFFNFSLKEWIHFWTTIRKEVLNFYDK
jgi:hypothetical protein